MEAVVFMALFLLGSVLGIYIGVSLSMRKPAQCVKHPATRRAAS